MLCGARRGPCRLARASPRIVIGKYTQHSNYSISVAWQKEGLRTRYSLRRYDVKRKSTLHGGRESENDEVQALAVMGIVSAVSPQQTTVKQLLDHIPAIANPPPLSFGKDAVITILLTPAFAHGALDPDLPLSLMRRLQNGIVQRPLQPVAYTAAVVDRLPAESFASGVEGLAYMLRPAIVYPGQQEESMDQYDTKAQNPGTIGFSFGVPNDDNAGNLRLELPLAHTIFSTGLVSTMVTGSFDCTAGKVLQGRYDERQLHKQTNIPLPCSADNLRYELSSPLLPLTPFRTIGNSMGNIVRTISAVSPAEVVRSGKNMQPASEELEAAVSAYFKARNLSPTAVNVWALITPGRKALQTDAAPRLSDFDTEQIRGMWTGTPEASEKFGRTLNAQIKHFINSGSRLHRVLSGGGGWGKKAGLLSLDPDSRYTARTLRNDEGWDFDFETETDEAYTALDMERQQKQALGTIVEEGEEIMFFIAPDEVNLRDGEFTEQLAEPINDIARKALFGVISSTVDEVPDQIASIRDINSTGIQHISGIFGAFSEGGMALEVRTPDASTHQTKFDIPGARLMTGTTAPAKPSEHNGGGMSAKVSVGRSHQKVTENRAKNMGRSSKSSPVEHSASLKMDYDMYPTVTAVEHAEAGHLQPQASVLVRKVPSMSEGRNSDAKTLKRTIDCSGAGGEPGLKVKACFAKDGDMTDVNETPTFGTEIQLDKDTPIDTNIGNLLLSKRAQSVPREHTGSPKVVRNHWARPKLVTKHLVGSHQIRTVRVNADETFPVLEKHLAATPVIGKARVEANAVELVDRADSQSPASQSTAGHSNSNDVHGPDDLSLHLMLGQVLGVKRVVRKVTAMKYQSEEMKTEDVFIRPLGLEQEVEEVQQPTQRNSE